jgi:hypothetical protein
LHFYHKPSSDFFDVPPRFNKLYGINLRDYVSILAIAICCIKCAMTSSASLNPLCNLLMWNALAGVVEYLSTQHRGNAAVTSSEFTHNNQPPVTMGG